jgi:hypothetical protein
MANQEEDEWQTHEISLAAFLALELELKGQPTYVWDGSTCYFIFQKTPMLVNEVGMFVSGDALVEPREYHMKVSELKKEMFKARREPSKTK